MFKGFLMGIVLLPMSVLANNTLNEKQFIGKWQCHIKHNNPLIYQENELHFLKNKTMSENIRIDYGKKDDYTHQIERATATATWFINNNQLHYTNHQFNHYSVRMPNANKDDIEQANIALQKSLPMGEMGNRKDKIEI